MASHAAIERVVREVVEQGAIPVVLGGDHSIAEPDIRAVAATHGKRGRFRRTGGGGIRCAGVDREEPAAVVELPWASRAVAASVNAAANSPPVW